MNLLTLSSEGNFDRTASKDAASALFRLVLLRFFMFCLKSSIDMPVVVFSRASTLNSRSEELAVLYLGKRSWGEISKPGARQQPAFALKASMAFTEFGE